MLAAAPRIRRDNNGVYGMIDSVIFEPVAGTHERVRVWGAFALADVIGLREGRSTIRAPWAEKRSHFSRGDLVF